MKPIVKQQIVTGNSFTFSRANPGVWYWKLTNTKGASKVRMFKINPPVERRIELIQPKTGSSIKNGHMIKWSGDSHITYYRMELSKNGWANPTYRFASSGTETRLNNIAPGKYEIRVGAFSEVSGRWEYSTPQKISVQ